MLGLNRSQHLALLTRRLYDCLADHTLIQVHTHTRFTLHHKCLCSSVAMSQWSIITYSVFLTPRQVTLWVANFIWYILTCHMSEMCSPCVPVAQRIHAGLGPHHPGAGDLLSWLAGSYHRPAEEGTGTRPSLFFFFFLLVATCGQSEALNAQCGSCNQSKQGTVLMEEQQNAQIGLLWKPEQRGNSVQV